MKLFKNHHLLLLLATGIAFAQSSKTVTLTLGFKPATTYRQTYIQNHKTTIKYKADEDVLKVLAEQGVQNPTVQEVKSDYTSELSTGKSLDGTTFPLTIKFIKAPDSFGKNGITSATKIYGHGEINTLPKIDSIVAPEMADALKKSVLKTLDGMFNQVKYPERPFKRGDTQQVVSPVTMPLAGTVLEMDLITDYTLVEIKSGIARFDIGISYKAKNNDPKYNITATGTGKGSMDYDIKKSFAVAQKSDILMQMAFTYKEFDMDIASEMHYDIKSAVLSDAK
ncbi:MAG: hypothetical protein ACOVRN_19550 [Flavobacterium sp.]